MSARTGRTVFPSRGHWRVALLAFSCLALILGLVSPTGARPLPGPAAASTIKPNATRPNLILIVTDDQRWDEMVNMPTVQSDLVAQGIDFPNAFVVNPSCCPSRTTLLTGRYSHGTDVYTNKPPHGGFETFQPEEGSTLATWLHGGGYYTGLIGKYLNGYDTTQVAHVPPGWDDWQALTLGTDEAGNGEYYNYTMSVGSSATGGTAEFHGKSAKNYSTDVLGKKAVDFIDGAPSSQPLFLYFAPYAPHTPITVAKKYKTSCSGLTWTNPPSFNEAMDTLITKPRYVRRHDTLTQTQIDKIAKHRLQDCQSLLSADQWVGSVTDALQSTGRLENSMIVFMSDNGYLFGEHRINGKTVPYDESIRVPMVIRYDALTTPLAGSADSDLVLNLDIAPTFADAAGVSVPNWVEGQSMLPLLADPNAPWRDHFLIEHWGEGGVPAYCGIRTADWKYVMYATGEQELYYLAGNEADGDGPYELENEVTNPAPLYQNELTSLRSIDETMCDPQPPGGLPFP
jgi:arylsulfatase A-like enzyme